MCESVDRFEKTNHTVLHVVSVLPQLGRYTKDGQIFLGTLGSTGEDTRCIVDDQSSNLPQLLNCDKVTNVKQKTWQFSQVRKKIIFFRKTDLHCFKTSVRTPHRMNQS